MLLIHDDRVKSLSIQALLFQVVMYVLIAISSVLSFILIGLPFLIVFVIMTVVVPVIGIVNAISEKDWQYPIVGRWV